MTRTAQTTTLLDVGRGGEDYGGERVSALLATRANSAGWPFVDPLLLQQVVGSQRHHHPAGKMVLVEERAVRRALPYNDRSTVPGWERTQAASPFTSVVISSRRWVQMP